MICEDRTTMTALVENFLAAKPKRRVFGNFRIEADGIYYRTQSKQTAWIDDETRKKIADGLRAGTVKLADEKLPESSRRIEYYNIEANVVAKRIPREGKPDLLIGNSSILPLVGRTIAWGNERDNRSETIVQKILSQKVPMIPFSVFEQANLDVSQIQIIDQGGPETITRKEANPLHRSWDKQSTQPAFVERTVHFTGASLFSVQGKYFLFDLDRRELQYKIFNPFLAELPRKVKTIAEAYESLKPEAVKLAEKRGQKVLRQGEWFFVPAKAPKVPKLTDAMILNMLAAEGSIWRMAAQLGKKRVKRVQEQARKAALVMPRQLELRAGNNRPNRCSRGLIVGGKTFVTGTVTHAGREHADLKLAQWYTPVANTATKSFTISGDID